MQSAFDHFLKPQLTLTGEEAHKDAVAKQIDRMQELAVQA